MDRVRELLGAEPVLGPRGCTLRWEREGRIAVDFAHGRGQRVRYKIRDQLCELRSTIARPAVVADIGHDHLARRLLQLNRTTEVVGFRLSRKGRLEGWVSQPIATLQREELVFYVALLAREADRLEHQLTGRDVH